MTGSIACYKACGIISLLHQRGYQVKVVMSPSSLEFVGKVTIEGLTGEPPITDMYASGSVMDHIHLVRWADLVLVAPATANYMNKISAGIGDDLLTTLFLAHDFKKPFLIAPAMNTQMYLHPTVQDSLAKLKKFGVKILETASGVLACGETGVGRLLEPQLIFSEVEKHLLKSTEQNLDNHNLRPSWVSKKIKILVTAGGTSEPIDDVRVISNISTGKTAAFLADQLILSGMEIHFFHAKTSARPNSFCQKTEFTSFSDLETKLNFILNNEKFDWIIHAAAISDYSVKKTDGKISSQSDELLLHLTKNKKLISEIKKQSANSKLIGFKLTSGNDEKLIEDKVKKLFIESNCDFVIQNDWINIEKGNHSFNFYQKNLDFIPIANQQNLSYQLFKTITQGVL